MTQAAISSGNTWILLDFLKFPNSEYWISDFLAKNPLSQPVPDINVSINITLVDEIPSQLDFERQEDHSDGKWQVVWGVKEKARVVLWRLKANPSTAAIVFSSLIGNKRFFDAYGTDENFLGKTLRYLIVIPQLISKSLVYLHASVLTNGREVIILLGSTGSGKTTYTYAAYKHSWEVLAEDFVLMRPNFTIERFFSTVEWECRIRPQDAHLINDLCDSTTKYRGDRDINFIDLDSRGRIKIYPPSFMNSGQDHTITSAILLDPVVASDFSNDITRINHLWLIDELKGRISLNALFDLYEADFDLWCEDMKDIFLSLRNRVPAFLTRKSGDLKSDLHHYFQLLDTLSGKELFAERVPEVRQIGIDDVPSD